MKTYFIIAFSIIACQTSGQSAYEVFKSYLGIKEQNKTVATVNELFTEDNHTWRRRSVSHFNSQGLPTSLIQHNDKGAEQERMDFIYDNNHRLSKIETYKKGKHEGTADFETNSLGQVILCTEYVYSSYDGEKMFLWETTFNYYPNHELEKSTRVEGQTKQDTVEVNFYDTSGTKTKSLWRMSGLRTTKIEYVWSKDKSEMKELHYEDDTSVYTTTVHKYKKGKQTEMIDPSTSPKAFYWKYDKNGRVIETNEAFYFITYNEYYEDGRLKRKTWNILLSDGPEQDLPKKMYFRYEYQLRK